MSQGYMRVMAIPIKPMCYLNPGKGNARAMLEAFAAGSNADITTKLQVVPGRPAVFWGVDPVTLPLWQEVQRLRHPFIYVDNGYFRSKWQGGDHYRVTLGAMQCTGEGNTTGERWRALGLDIKPWRSGGKHVLVACQSDFWHHRHGHGTAERFAAAVKAELAKAGCQHPVVVRHKPIHGKKEPPLQEQLDQAVCVVTHSSMVACEGLLMGVPAITLSGAATWGVARHRVDQVHDLLYPEDRERWAGVLADNQWRLPEIRDGTCWRQLGAQ